MDVAIYLIPISIIFGCILLWLLIWNIKSGQYDDLDNEAIKILFEQEDENNHIINKVNKNE